MKTRLVFIAVLTSLCAATVSAEGPASIAPRAEEQLRRAVELLAASPQLSFRADVTIDEVAATGQKLQRGGVVDIRVRRPNRVFVDHDGDMFHRKSVYDGKTMTILDMGQNLYASFDAPPTIDEMLKFAKAKFGVVLPLGEVIVAKPVEAMVPNIESGLYLGVHKIAGTPCHHLAFTQAAVDWQLWVEDGPKPLLRKIVVTYKNLPQSPQFTAVFRDWDLSTPIPDKTFKRELPQGASKIDFIAGQGSDEVKP